jgi:hypothetical protein
MSQAAILHLIINAAYPNKFGDKRYARMTNEKFMFSSSSVIRVDRDFHL